MYSCENVSETGVKYIIAHLSATGINRLPNMMFRLIVFTRVYYYRYNTHVYTIFNR